MVSFHVAFAESSRPFEVEGVGRGGGGGGGEGGGEGEGGGRGGGGGGEAGLWRWGRMDGNLRRGEFPLTSNPRAFQLDRHSIMEQLSVSDWCNSSEMISDKIWPSRISINLHMTLTNLYQRYI